MKNGAANVLAVVQEKANKAKGNRALAGHVRPSSPLKPPQIGDLLVPE